MILLYWILGILAAYFFLVFVVLRLIVPFMGFGRMKVPKELPREITDKIKELEAASASQREYLEKAYSVVVARWNAGRFRTITYAPLAFRRNLSKIWNGHEYGHCNTQNYMLFVLLTGSKYFNAEDTEARCVIFNFFIHQYLRVKVGDRWIDADPAGSAIRGLPLGTHIEFFG